MLARVTEETSPMEEASRTIPARRKALRAVRRTIGMGVFVSIVIITYNEILCKYMI
jgi:hypothetical protein